MEVNESYEIVLGFMSEENPFKYYYWDRINAKIGERKGSNGIIQEVNNREFYEVVQNIKNILLKENMNVHFSSSSSSNGKYVGCLQYHSDDFKNNIMFSGKGNSLKEVVDSCFETKNFILEYNWDKDIKTNNILSISITINNSFKGYFSYCKEENKIYERLNGKDIEVNKEEFGEVVKSIKPIFKRKDIENYLYFSINKQDRFYATLVYNDVWFNNEFDIEFFGYGDSPQEAFEDCFRIKDFVLGFGENCYGKN